MLADLFCKRHFIHILTKLDGSSFDFHLTGSCFFRNSYVTGSDIDFFTQNTPEVEKFLLDLGFIKRLVHMYLDANTIAVYRLIGEINIDIQLEKNVHQKIIVQKAISAAFGYTFCTLSKVLQGKVWRTCYDIISSEGSE
jgi:hypothetical protein